MRSSIVLVVVCCALATGERSAAAQTLFSSNRPVLFPVADGEDVDEAAVSGGGARIVRDQPVSRPRQRPAAERESESPWFVRAGYELGWVHQGSDFVKGRNLAGKKIASARAFKVEVGTQTDGSRDWHHAYQFPSYGVGFYGADFGNETELGSPFAAYGFMTLPLVTLSQRLKLTTDFGIGMAFGVGAHLRRRRRREEA